MEYLVIADFKVNDGMADDMANVFKEALVDTRAFEGCNACLLYTSPSPRDVEESRMPSSA